MIRVPLATVADLPARRERRRTLAVTLPDGTKIAFVQMSATLVGPSTIRIRPDVSTF